MRYASVADEIRKRGRDGGLVWFGANAVAGDVRVWPAAPPCSGRRAESELAGVGRGSTSFGAAGTESLR
jgi:hypothetical protein